MIYAKFDWNWPAGSGEEDFFQYKHWIYKYMVFPIVAPLDPQEPWCEQFWIYIISEIFHVNMKSSGSVVCENKIFKWSHSIFAFLWLSPLWKGSGLDLCNFEFPLPKDDLYQVLLKLACWFWKRRFFQCKHIEIWFSLLWSLPTHGDHGLYKLESTLY